MRHLLVVCLCAAWCRLCDDYAPVLQQVTAEFDGRDDVALQSVWLDIEDEADLIDDFDVPTFPTLLAIEGARLRFAGPLTPQPDTLRRLLRSWLDDDTAGAALAAHAFAPEALALAQRLRQRYPAGASSRQ